MLRVTKIRVNVSDSLQIVDSPPVFSVVVESGERNIRLAGYRMEVSVVGQIEKGSVIWDETFSDSDPAYVRLPESVCLQPHMQYAVRAMVWSVDGAVSQWSASTLFETGFLQENWKARFIFADVPAKEADVCPCFIFKRKFVCPFEVFQARLYITAKGVYKPFLNGHAISDDVLTPGYMSYHKHLAYQTYDVTDELVCGENDFEALLGDGWYKGYLSSSWHRNYYGDRRELLCELHVLDVTGHHVVLASDDGFTWSESPILMSEIYSGETCDRSEQPENLWRPVLVGKTPKPDYLHPSIANPMHMSPPCYPERLFSTPSGELLLDFGYVLSGTIELHVSGQKGSRVILQCSDTLDVDGNFYNENVELFSLKGPRPVMQRIEYRLSGEGMEVFRPTFTYQCFRYVKIVQFPGKPQIENFRAIPISSFVRQTGYFESGNYKLNSFFQNVIRTEQATYMDIPLAGPQRAERLGWTGDNQLVVAMSCKTMFETFHFYGKWLEDVRLDQGTDGQVGVMAPFVSFDKNDEHTMENPSASAAWGDAATVVPWRMYSFYGDTAWLRKYAELARKYVDYMHHSGPDELFFTEGFSFGDWFALDDGEDAYAGKTDKILISCFYFYYSTCLLTKILRAIEDPDVEKYRLLAERIHHALLNRYFAEDGTLLEPTQTACAMALYFGLATEPAKVAAQLTDLIHRAGDSLQTGFLGTSMVLQALCDHGYEALACELILSEKYPSFLYSLRYGATTVWEHWNGLKPKGEFWDANMNSFCHLTFGSVVDWLYEYLLGVRQNDLDAGFQHLKIAPIPVRKLGYVSGAFETVRGRVHMEWKYLGPELRVELHLPVGVDADITLPHVKRPRKYVDELQLMGHEASCKRQQRSVSVHCNSGTYVFRYLTTK